MLKRVTIASNLRLFSLRLKISTEDYILHAYCREVDSTNQVLWLEKSADENIFDH